MICGVPPFAAPTRKGTIEQIMKYKDDLTFPERIPISDQCKDFITSLLKCNPEIRLSAHEALQHEWIVNEGNTYQFDESITGNTISGQSGDTDYSITAGPELPDESSASFNSQHEELSMPSGYKIDSKRTSSTLNSSAISAVTRSLMSNAVIGASVILPPLADVQENAAVSSEDFDFGYLDGLDINEYLDSVELETQHKRPQSALASAMPSAGLILSNNKPPELNSKNSGVYETMTVDQNRPNTTKAVSSPGKGKKSQFRFSSITPFASFGDMSQLANILAPEQDEKKQPEVPVTNPAIRAIKSVDYLYEN